MAKTVRSTRRRPPPAKRGIYEQGLQLTRVLSNRMPFRGLRFLFWRPRHRCTRQSKVALSVWIVPSSHPFGRAGRSVAWDKQGRSNEPAVRLSLCQSLGKHSILTAGAAGCLLQNVTQTSDARSAGQAETATRKKYLRRIYALSAIGLCATAWHAHQMTGVRKQISEP